MGLSAPNVAGHLNKLHVLFNTAVSEDLLALQSGPKRPRKESKQQTRREKTAFHPEQVHRIFEELK